MNLKHTFLIITFSSFYTYSCGNSLQKAEIANKQQTTEALQSQEESPALKKRIQPIRDNFTRINKISKWENVEKRSLKELSTEGGEATYYYANGKLEKIATVLYGETGKLVSEFYLLNGELSFVFEQFHEYNRPIYYDKAMAQENEDNEWYDPKKTKLIERRYYFENENIFHLKSKDDEDVDDIRALETERHMEFYGQLIKLQMD